MSRACLSWMSRIFLVVLVALVCSAYAQDATPQADDPNDATLRVDGDRIKGYIEWLSRDEMQGRQSLTPEYKKAAEWAAANFKKWGLQPAGQDGTYFQDVPVERGFTYRTGTPELRVGNTSFLLEEEDYAVLDLSTEATRVDAEIVFVGYGISAPDKGLDEYEGMDVKDKIVLVLAGSPHDATQPRASFGPPVEGEGPAEAWKEESTDQAKIETAHDKGAAGILLYADSKAEEKDRSTRQTREVKKELDGEQTFLAFTINDRVFRTIMKPDRQESVRGFERRLASMRWDIRNKTIQSTATGMKARLKGFDNIQEYSKDLKNNIERNVIAKLPGTDPELKKQYIIMGGHMDHVGVRNGLVRNGADDNASGTAVTMEVARVLSEAGYKPKRTIIFCCWCAEELGLIGSRHYVANPCDDVTMDQVVTYFNMDMVGLGDKIGAPGALNFPTIWDVIKKDQDKDVISVVEPSTGGPGGSDFAPFIELGIEALALMTRGGGGHPSYHQPEDDAHKMIPEILRKTGQFVLQGTLNLDQDTETTLLIEDRQALYDGMRLTMTYINPDMSGSHWNRENLTGYSQDKLRWRMASVEEKPRKAVEKGVRDLKLFDGDVELLVAASEALGFGRVDIQGSDGTWIVKGQLTEEGRYFLGMMEEKNVVVNLVDPAPQLLRDVLAAATRPFMVSGFYLLDPSTYKAINEKQVLLAVKFDPADVAGCIERLEEIKVALGDTDNLIVSVTSTNKLDEAKQDLYVRLIKNGWTKEEIGSSRRGRRRRGSGERPKGIAGDSLSVFGQ